MIFCADSKTINSLRIRFCSLCSSLTFTWHTAICSAGVSPSIVLSRTPAASCCLRPPIRFIWNSSRLLPVIARYLTRSSSGVFESAAMLNTRPLNASHVSSRLRYSALSSRSISAALATTLLVPAALLAALAFAEDMLTVFEGVFLFCITFAISNSLFHLQIVFFIVFFLKIQKNPELIIFSFDYITLILLFYNRF